MEDLLLSKNLEYHLNKMKILGKGIDNYHLIFLSLLVKYKKYTVTHTLTSEGATIDSLIFKLKNYCSELCK